MSFPSYTWVLALTLFNFQAFAMQEDIEKNPNIEFTDASLQEINDEGKHHKKQSDCENGEEEESIDPKDQETPCLSFDDFLEEIFETAYELYKSEPHLSSSEAEDSDDDSEDDSEISFSPELYNALSPFKKLVIFAHYTMLYPNADNIMQIQEYSAQVCYDKLSSKEKEYLEETIERAEKHGTEEILNLLCSIIK